MGEEATTEKIITIHFFKSIKTKEVMRPPQGGRESQAGEASGTLSYQEELLGASLVAQW